jgi:hypothetical protein
MIGATALPPASAFFLPLTIIGIVGVVMGLGGLAALWFTAPKESPAPAAVGAPIKPLSIPFRYPPSAETELPKKVTPEYIFGLCSGKTQVQMAGTIEPFLGKRLTVTGTAFAVTKVGDQISVGLEMSVNGRRPTGYLLFNEDLDRVRMIDQDEEITVSGRLFEVSPSELKLEDCRLL